MSRDLYKIPWEESYFHLQLRGTKPSSIKTIQLPCSLSLSAFSRSLPFHIKASRALGILPSRKNVSRHFSSTPRSCELNVETGRPERQHPSRMWNLLHQAPQNQKVLMNYSSAQSAAKPSIQHCRRNAPAVTTRSAMNAPKLKTSHDREPRGSKRVVPRLRSCRW